MKIFAFFVAAILAAPAPAADAPVQSREQAIAEDAVHYAVRQSVTLEEAVRRLRAQEDSGPVTDRIAAALRHRLAGISIQHQPHYRIVVLLTGNEPVADPVALAAGSPVPIVFQPGAPATREQILAAMIRHQPLLRRELPRARGMGLDQRTGELVLYVGEADASRLSLPAIERRAEDVTGVPVRVALAEPAKNLLRGGALLIGDNPATGRRHGCTSGFAVRNGARTGIVTAAHCADSMVYRTPDGEDLPLEFAGGWGVGHQDVQVHVGPEKSEPLFYANRRAGSLRPVTGSKHRTGARAGDSVCHWGEASGYSCSEIELTDYAPPGDLCGGPCTPGWVTVRGPGCKAGDSGGPVFSGTVAYGILKGGSGLTTRCNFYYYMSTDYLPDGWTLMTALENPPPPRPSIPSQPAG